VRQFLLRARSLAWDHGVVRAYADLRASCQSRGVGLAALDMMIAGHAVSVGAVLVTHDRAFRHVGSPLVVEDWIGP
jgi:tRNA(fMet)-specific endonuclease VapC